MRNTQSGLTLVEIMVVLVILALVMGFIATKMFQAGDKAKVELTKIQLQNLKNSIDEFRLRYNSIPGSLDELSSCSEKTGQGCVPIVSKDSLKDAWGNAFAYSLENSGRAYRIKSFGTDAREGGEGINYDVFVEGP